jgi:hypothetical protein
MAVVTQALSQLQSLILPGRTNERGAPSACVLHFRVGGGCSGPTRLRSTVGGVCSRSLSPLVSMGREWPIFPHHLLRNSIEALSAMT